MDFNDSIFVAGGTGLLGSSLVRKLSALGYENILAPKRQELDLSLSDQVHAYFKKNKPQHVFIAAGKVAGIEFNSSHQADMLHENLRICTNIIEASLKESVETLVNIGSSCVYPRVCSQPMKEDSILSGSLEPTNEGYAIAKIAALKMCEKYNEQYGKKFITVIPANAYGPGDNFNPEFSHVIPALMRRFHAAELAEDSEVSIWGSGSQVREFVYVDDISDGLIFLAKNYSDIQPVNLGTGSGMSIKDLSTLVAEIVGYKGSLVFDTSKPDGMPKKTLDSSKILSMGWSPETSLKVGLSNTYAWFLEQKA